MQSCIFALALVALLGSCHCFGLAPPALGGLLARGSSRPTSLRSATSLFSTLGELLTGFSEISEMSSLSSSPLADSRVAAGMKLDVAPQVVSAFKTAAEQNECLAVVNAAVAELNKSDKAIKEIGKAGEVPTPPPHTTVTPLQCLTFCVA